MYKNAEMVRLDGRAQTRLPRIFFHASVPNCLSVDAAKVEVMLRSSYTLTLQLSPVGASDETDPCSLGVGGSA